MILDLNGVIKRGIIDNTIRGYTELTLWNFHDEKPLILMMPGNCCEDVAATKLTFHIADTPPEEEPSEEIWEYLNVALADGAVYETGEITLSRRRREQNNRKAACNVLSIEFFMDRQVRIIFETEVFDFNLSLPAFEYSQEDASVQSMLSLQLTRAFVQNYLNIGADTLRTQAGPLLPLCEWDFTLQRAETCDMLARMMRNKYVDAYSESACLATIFDLPDLFSRVAYEEESDVEPEDADFPRSLTPRDFLTPEQHKLLTSIMDKPLFLHTMDFATQLEDCYLLGYDAQLVSQDFIHAQRGAISMFSSRLMATMLLIQEGAPDFTPTMIRRRFDFLYSLLKDITLAIPRNAPKVKAIKQLAEELKQAIQSEEDSLPGDKNRR